VGGDRIEVQTVVPEGTEPHDFEPKARDMENISRAKLFVYNGLGMENWAADVLDSISSKSLIVVEASKGCSLIENGQEEAKEHGQYDPHTWLSLKEAKVEAANTRDGLIKADPEGRDTYEKNYNTFAGKLDALYNEYKPKFDAAQNKHFVTGHAAFGYLCRDFGLQQNSVEDVFAAGEPSPRKIADLIDYCRANNVKTVFVEEMVSPKVSETLANEIGGRVEKIYTIESKEEGRDYIESMRENLNRILKSF
jgi:zinc transport system substrate-binding protein